MLAQSYLVDEVEVGIEYILRRLVVEDTDKQANNAFHNECVALCLEVDMCAVIICLQPNAALTAFDEVALCLVFLVQGWQTVAHVNEQLVAVHPVVKVLKLFDNLLL